MNTLQPENVMAEPASKPQGVSGIGSKDGLGDIVASKTKFVMQILDTKGNGEWADQNYHNTAQAAIEAMRREAKWDFDHDMTRWKYRAIIRIQSDHLLSPNDRS